MMASVRSRAASSSRTRWIVFARPSRSAEMRRAIAVDLKRSRVPCSATLLDAKLSTAEGLLEHVEGARVNGPADQLGVVSAQARRGGFDRGREVEAHLIAPQRMPIAVKLREILRSALDCSRFARAMQMPARCLGKA